VAVTAELIETVQRLDERDEFEPFLRCILAAAINLATARQSKTSGVSGEVEFPNQ
jgi:hypothetical protein